jgi:hypothetical protein
MRVSSEKGLGVGGTLQRPESARQEILNEFLISRL